MRIDTLRGSLEATGFSHLMVQLDSLMYVVLPLPKELGERACNPTQVAEFLGRALRLTMTVNSVSDVGIEVFEVSLQPVGGQTQDDHIATHSQSTQKESFLVEDLLTKSDWSALADRVVSLLQSIDPEVHSVVKNNTALVIAALCIAMHKGAFDPENTSPQSPQMETHSTNAAKLLQKFCDRFPTKSLRGARQTGAPAEHPYFGDIDAVLGMYDISVSLLVLITIDFEVSAPIASTQLRTYANHVGRALSVFFTTKDDSPTFELFSRLRVASSALGSLLGLNRFSVQQSFQLNLRGLAHLTTSGEDLQVYEAGNFVAWEPTGEHVVEIDDSLPNPVPRIRCASCVDTSKVIAVSYEWSKLRGTSFEWPGGALECADGCGFVGGNPTQGGLQPSLLPKPQTGGSYWIDHFCVRGMPEGLASIHKSAALYSGRRVSIMTQAEADSNQKQVISLLESLTQVLEEHLARVREGKGYGITTLGQLLVSWLDVGNPFSKLHRGWLIWEDASCLGSDLLIFSEPDHGTLTLEWKKCDRSSVAAALLHSLPSTCWCLLQQLCLGRKIAMQSLLTGCFTSGHMYDTADVAYASSVHNLRSAAQQMLLRHFRSVFLSELAKDKDSPGLFGFPNLHSPASQSGSWLGAVPSEKVIARPTVLLPPPIESIQIANNSIMVSAVPRETFEGFFLHLGEHPSPTRLWDALGLDILTFAELVIQGMLASNDTLKFIHTQQDCVFEAGMPEDKSKLIFGLCATLAGNADHQTLATRCTVHLNHTEKLASVEFEPWHREQSAPVGSLAGFCIGLDEPHTDLSVRGSQHFHTIRCGAVEHQLHLVPPFAALVDVADYKMM